MSASMAAFLAEEAVKEGRAQAADARAQRYYKENQAQLFRYSMESQRQAASNAVAGLKAAGISPAFATGASGMSIGAAQAPHSQVSGGQPDSSFDMVKSNLATQAKERDLLDAQKKFVESKTTGQDIDNDNKEGANFVAKNAFDGVLNSYINDAKAHGDSSAVALFDSLRNSGNVFFNAGGLDSLHALAGQMANYSDAANRRINNYLNDLVISKQVNNADVINSLAVAPFLKSEKVRAEIGELSAMQVKLYADADNAKALLPAYQRQVDKVVAEIRESGVKADEIHNSDIQTAIADGDWKRVASIAVVDGGKIALNALGFYIGGRGLAAGKAAAAAPVAAGKAAAAAPVAPAHPLKAQAGKPPKAVRDSYGKDYGRPATPEERHEILSPYLFRKNDTSRFDVKSYERINGKLYYRDATGNYIRVTK